MFPGGRRFAFTVVDDTDNSTVANVKPVYDLLREVGMRTTKTVWCLPPRGRYSGQSLADAPYVEWIRELKQAGFEIGLHNVGDGVFSRTEIIAALESFRSLLGAYPRLQCNHVSNADNLYWWDRRFEPVFAWLYRVLYRAIHQRPIPSGGECMMADWFWGDVAANRIDYVRNLCFNDIDTLRIDPKMPWHDPAKPFVNYWFSSSDGHDVRLFNELVSRRNVDRLVRSGGACIVYTHFASGFVAADGSLDPEFESRIRYLASLDGWFVPASEMLDYLRDQGGEAPGRSYRLRLNVIWAIHRLAKKLLSGL